MVPLRVVPHTLKGGLEFATVKLHYSDWSCRSSGTRNPSAKLHYGTAHATPTFTAIQVATS